jgi:hypothetical protein
MCSNCKSRDLVSLALSKAQNTLPITIINLLVLEMKKCLIAHAGINLKYLTNQNSGIIWITSSG